MTVGLAVAAEKLALAKPSEGCGERQPRMQACNKSIGLRRLPRQWLI